MDDSTNLEQSQKLAEILSIDYADRVLLHEEPYETSDSKFDGLHIVLCVPFKKYNTFYKQKYKNISYFPCFSVVSLLNYIKDKFKYFELVYLANTTDGRGNRLENVFRLSIDLHDVYEKNIIDACYKMITWLKENDRI